MCSQAIQMKSYVQGVDVLLTVSATQVLWAWTCFSLVPNLSKPGAML